MTISWQDVPVERYLNWALTLSEIEYSRLEAALALLPCNLIDAHTHVCRYGDIQTLSGSLMSHVVSTFPVFTFDMAARARSVLWPGKQFRSARMAHAICGYRHEAINDYLLRELPKGDLLVWFGLPSSPQAVIQSMERGEAVALKMYFHSVEPPLIKVRDIFPDPILKVATRLGIPIILHLPTALPDELGEVTETAQRHPGLNIMLAHLGGHGGQGWTPRIKGAYAELRDLPNVFMDTAFIWDANLIREAVNALGCERLLFGTDEPLSLIRATGYHHARLGPRLYAPDYHWTTDDDVPSTVTGQTPVLLHIQMVEAIVEAVSGDRNALKSIFHDNAQLLFSTSKQRVAPMAPQLNGQAPMNTAATASQSDLISVVIPTYNHAKFLLTAVASVQAQSYRNFEIIVVDDGSTDGTLEVLRKCYQDEVHYIWQPNRGLAAARNTGLRACRGQYIVFLDADDRLLPHHFEVSLRAIRQFPDVAFVCGNLRTFGLCEDFQHVHACEPSPDHYASLLRGCFIVNVGTCLFRRDTLVEVGGFEEGLSACEDWNLFLRIVRQNQMHCHHEIVMEYQRRPGQMSQEGGRMFASAYTVLSSERNHFTRVEAYLSAYRVGIQSVVKYYGDEAVADLGSLLKRMELRKAWSLFVKLAHWYPRGLLGRRLAENFTKGGGDHLCM